MRVKLFSSAVGVVGVCVISIMAYVKSLDMPNVYIDNQTIKMLPVSNVTVEQLNKNVSVITTPEPTEVSYHDNTKKLNLNEEDRYLLAKIAMAEAGDQDVQGKALVILVVINRVLDNDFPNTVADVIYKENQFSSLSNGIFEDAEPDGECWTALNMVLEENWDKSEGALYFEGSNESTWHEKNLKFLFKYGGHYFYKEKEEEN